jgi:hypothetical protein
MLLPNKAVAELPPTDAGCWIASGPHHYYSPYDKLPMKLHSTHLLMTQYCLTFAMWTPCNCDNLSSPTSEGDIAAILQKNVGD